MKLTDAPLGKDNVGTDITVFEITKSILEHLYSYFNDVLSPMM